MTHEILKTFARIGANRYFYNSADQGRHQVKAYKRAASQPEFLDADWVMALDLDEFLHIRTGSGHLNDLFKALPAADQVLINWRRFGNDGQDQIDDALVVERFQSAEPEARVAEMLTPFKTLFRPRHFTRCGIHQARGPKLPADQIRTVNGSGLPAGSFAQKRFRIRDPKCRDLVQINHYMTRDAASFTLKSNRGSAHQANREIGEKYWNNRNFNQENDTGLASRAEEIRAAMAELDAQSGGRLSSLRAKSIARHRERFVALLEQPEYRALYQHCVSA